jgi:hypothetical protein
VLTIINALENVAVENLCSEVLMAADHRSATEVLVKAARHLEDPADPGDQVQTDSAPEVVAPAAQKVSVPAVLVVVPSAQWPVGRVPDPR